MVFLPNEMVLVHKQLVVEYMNIMDPLGTDSNVSIFITITPASISTAPRSPVIFGQTMTKPFIICKNTNYSKRLSVSVTSKDIGY
jgi:hypothetical protein